MGCNASQALNPSNERSRLAATKCRIDTADPKEQNAIVRFKGDSSIESLHYIGEDDPLSKQNFNLKNQKAAKDSPNQPTYLLQPVRESEQSPQDLSHCEVYNRVGDTGRRRAVQPPNPSESVPEAIVSQSLPQGPHSCPNLHETSEDEQFQSTPSMIFLTSPPPQSEIMKLASISQPGPLTTNEIDISSISREEGETAANLLHQFDSVASRFGRRTEEDRSLSQWKEDRSLSQWTLKPLLHKELERPSTAGKTSESPQGQVSISEHMEFGSDLRNMREANAEFTTAAKDVTTKGRFVLEADTHDGPQTVQRAKDAPRRPSQTTLQVPSLRTVPAGFVRSITCDREVKSRRKIWSCPHGNCFLCSSCSETMTPIRTSPGEQVEFADRPSKESQQVGHSDEVMAPPSLNKVESACYLDKVEGASTGENQQSHTPRLASIRLASTDLKGCSMPPDNSPTTTTPVRPSRRDYYLEVSPDPCIAPPRRATGLAAQNPIPPEWYPPSLMPESWDATIATAMDLTLVRPGHDEEEMLKSLDPGLPSLELQQRVTELLGERKRNDEIQAVPGAKENIAPPSQESDKKSDEENAEWINFIASRKPIPLNALPSLDESLPSVAPSNVPRSCPRPPMIAAAEAALAFPWRAGTKSLLYGCTREQLMPNHGTETKPLKALPPSPFIPKGLLTLKDELLTKQSLFTPSSKALKACGAEPPPQLTRTGRRTGSLPSMPFGMDSPVGKVTLGAFAETTTQTLRPTSANRAASLSAVAGIPKHVRSNGRQARRVSFDPCA